MAKFPAMPLWTDAYLSDCGHLDDAETGRYLLLLMYLWRAPGQRFPNDDEWLARKFRRSVEDVRTQIRPLIIEFCRCTGNWISQDRLTREFAYVLSKSKKQSARAKSRIYPDKDVSPGNAPTPTPTPEVKKEAKASQKKGTRLAADWHLPKVWGDWAVQRGLDPPAIRREAEKFGNYWQSKPGQGASKLDWFKTWQTWCITALERNPTRANTGDRRDDEFERIVQLAAGAQGRTTGGSDMAGSEVRVAPELRLGFAHGDD